ncbi:MAG: hypothetical protein ALECFALPRED_001730 [Alectoria fallacina]|uniref:Methyltransferase domain-containing protein n=1 Tax=Alectoria fallacina TaxID=1903189 RepID=A0A8H3FHV7_9LECA|nr:MAG: hypothetical protein ALECFALPRED_001730 [Alectoria fallacina]
MSTQYDTIQAPYDQIRKSSIALIERANIEEAVAPFIKNARVLDLACGSAFYSYHFLKWGASKIVGVDISSAMIEEARAASEVPSNGANISFMVADCSKPVPYEGDPFDVVFGAWLLNYAPSGKDMVDMFRNVAVNLKDGGHFVAVTPPPTQDPAAFVEAERKARPIALGGSGGLFCNVTGVVEDGIAFHAHADTRHGEVDFDGYHLRKEVYEASAREGGLCGEVAWSVTTVPADFFKDRQGGASVEELDSYKVTPHFGMLLIAK